MLNKLAVNRHTVEIRSHLLEASNQLRLKVTKQPLLDSPVKLEDELEQHPFSNQNTE